MSAMAMYYLLYGTMPDELFGVLLAAPIGIVAAAFQDWAKEWWRG